MRSRNTLDLVVIILWMGGIGVAASGVTPQDTFKEALMQETTVRDLESAIPLYETVAKDPSAPRDLRAKALLRSGNCSALLGRAAMAKATWTQVADDFSDQTESAREAVLQIQTLDARERPVERVIVGSPVVKIVHDLRPTRWEWEFLRFQLNSPLGGSSRLDYSGGGGALPLLSSLSYYYKSNRAIGFHGAYLGNVGYAHATQSIEYVGPFWRIEKPVYSAFRPYLTIGAAAYHVHSSYNSYTSIANSSWDFANSVETKSEYWTPGANGEAGFILGLSKGFCLTFGYAIHAMATATPNVTYTDYGGKTHSEQGFRGMHGPVFAMSYRW